MAQDTTPAIVVYRGNGDNSVPYDIPFDKGYYGEIKVAFIRRGLDDYTYEPDPSNYTVNGRLYAWFSGTGYVYTHTPNPAVGADIYNNFDEPTGDTVSAISGQTITVYNTTYSRATQHDIANQLLLTWTGTVLTSDDIICIARETERGQPYEYPNNQKHIEYALDNLERQIQEVAKKADNALLVDPAWMDEESGGAEDTTKMNPIDWLKSIIRCMDFSVRALRYANGWLDYSLDDPNIADGDKTWYHLLNTDNVKNIRERKEIVDGVEHRWLEYLDQEGNWYTASDSTWEGRIEEAERIAQEAKDTAEEAKDIAEDANDKSDEAVEIAQAAQDAVSNIYSERVVFTIASGQTTLHFDESIEDKIIDLYWNGQLITQTGNWTVSDDTITLLFPVDTGDTIAVFLSAIRQVVEFMDLTSHNTSPLSHANLVSYILGQLSTHNANSTAHANLMAVHNADLNAHQNLVAQILASDIDCGTL